MCAAGSPSSKDPLAAAAAISIWPPPAYRRPDGAYNLPPCASSNPLLDTEYKDYIRLPDSVAYDSRHLTENVMSTRTLFIGCITKRSA